MIKRYSIPVKIMIYLALFILSLLILYFLLSVIFVRVYTDSKIKLYISLETKYNIIDIRYMNFSSYDDAIEYSNNIITFPELFENYLQAKFEGYNSIVVSIGKSYISYGVLSYFGIKRLVISRYILLLFLDNKHIIHSRIIKYENSDIFHIKL